jgi:phage shock protein A
MKAPKKGSARGSLTTGKVLRVTGQASDASKSAKAVSLDQLSRFRDSFLAGCSAGEARYHRAVVDIDMLAHMAASALKRGNAPLARAKVAEIRSTVAELFDNIKRGDEMTV